MVHRYAHDFRINPEDPALFGWWATLPHSRDSIPLNVADAFFEGAPGNLDQQWWFVVETLYSNRDARQADRLLDQSRAMFTILGVALGALIACWAYQIAGGWAAITASMLFCFDPNFLGHASLVKNDVPLSLMMLLFGFFLWKFGKRGAYYWLVLAAITCGLAFNVKFSAVLFGPLLFLLLAIRALMPGEWIVGGAPLQNWQQRIGIVLGGSALTVCFIFLITWSVYGNRFVATPTGQMLNNTPMIVKSVKNTILMHLTPKQIDGLANPQFSQEIEQRVHDEQFPPVVRFDLWLQKNHVLPEGWLFGFLYTYTTTLIRAGYLMGEVKLTGWWYYFPLTMLFKTPAAVLMGIFAIPPACLAARLTRKDSALTPIKFWTPIVLILPPVIYFFTALSANLNLGLRHVLPVYPYLFIALGVGMATLISRWPIPSAALISVLVMGLIVETTLAYPNYISFFNVFGNAAGGGYKLLGDSNLDWGQDLPALADWRKEHPEGQLYLSYFGTAAPTSYGLSFINIPGSWPFAATANLDMNKPGVIAISATNLQGIYIGKSLTDQYQAALRNEKPFKILNNTIYLYTWPPSQDQN